MTYKQVKTMVAGIGLPYAYYQFTEDTAVAPPFICFYYPDSDDFVADDKNYQRIRPLYIELYTDRKDITKEELVETALTANELPYARNEVYIEAEKMYLVTFITEVVING